MLAADGDDDGEETKPNTATTGSMHNYLFSVRIACRRGFLSKDVKVIIGSCTTYVVRMDDDDDANHNYRHHNIMVSGCLYHELEVRCVLTF